MCVCVCFYIYLLSYFYTCNMYQPLSILFPRYIFRTEMLTRAFSSFSDYLTSIQSLNDKSEKREIGCQPEKLPVEVSVVELVDLHV